MLGILNKTFVDFDEGRRICFETVQYNISRNTVYPMGKQSFFDIMTFFANRTKSNKEKGVFP